MLGRDTNWRQGDLICYDDAISLGLQGFGEPDNHAIIISHDCDLASDHETSVEIIVGQSILEVNGMCTGAKNPRRLHITFENSDNSNSSLHVELQHLNRLSVDKSCFESIEGRRSPYVLPLKEKLCLKQWLASRYARPAFPNSFENRLKKKVPGGTVVKKIERIIEPHASGLIGLFVDLGTDRYIELEEGEPYALSIVVVYDTIEGGPRARENAEAVSSGLESLFHTAFGVPEDAVEIALESCRPISDASMTLADVRRLDQWRLEHISLRSDDKGDFLCAGEMPP